MRGPVLPEASVHSLPGESPSIEPSPDTTSDSRKPARKVLINVLILLNFPFLFATFPVAKMPGRARELRTGPHTWARTACARLSHGSSCSLGLLGCVPQVREETQLTSDCFPGGDVIFPETLGCVWGSSLSDVWRPHCGSNASLIGNRSLSLPSAAKKCAHF